jgi:hypothetical protein
LCFVAVLRLGVAWPPAPVGVLGMFTTT